MVDETTTGLHYLDPSPLGGLALAVHRVHSPRATVVALHGGLDRGSSFTRLSRRLPEFDVVAPDRRGYQRSRDLGPGTLADHLSDLDRILDWVGDQTPVILVGHSFGGLIAMAQATWDRVPISRCVVFESPLPWVLTRPSPTPPPGTNAPLEAERFFRRVVSDEAWEHLSEREKESRRLDGPALHADLMSMTEPLAPFEPEDVRVPVLYLYGDQRSGDYYSALTRLLTSRNPHFSSRRLTGLPHGAHLSHPDVLAAQIRGAADLID